VGGWLSDGRMDGPHPPTRSNARGAPARTHRPAPTLAPAYLHIVWAFLKLLPPPTHVPRPQRQRSPDVSPAHLPGDAVVPRPLLLLLSLLLAPPACVRLLPPRLCPQPLRLERKERLPVRGGGVAPCAGACMAGWWVGLVGSVLGVQALMSGRLFQGLGGRAVVVERLAREPAWRDRGWVWCPSPDVWPPVPGREGRGGGGACTHRWHTHVRGRFGGQGSV
jgi:hypothetical protein